MPHFKTQEGIKIFYEYSPKKGKATLVFMHGLGLDHTIWNRFAEHFSKDYGILMMDLRGHGKSSKPRKAEKYAIGLFSKDLHDLLAEMDITEYYLIGFSLGGLVASDYAERYKANPKGVVLISTPSSYSDVWEIYLKGVNLMSAIPNDVFRKIDAPGNYADLRENEGMYIKTLAESSHQAAMKILEGLSKYIGLKKLGCRHLVIVAMNDEVIKKGITKIYDKYVSIPGTHCAPLFKREETIRLIEGFLKKE